MSSSLTLTDNSSQGIREKFDEKTSENPLTVVVSGLIEEIIGKNLPKKEKKIDFSSLFKGKNISKVTIRNYVSRLNKYFLNEQASLVVSLIYLDRICEITQIKLAQDNFHRLFLVSLVVAIKYTEDKYFLNSYYAKVGGVSLEDFNKLESEFIKAIEYFLYIDDEVFGKYVMYLRNLIAQRTAVGSC